MQYQEKTEKMQLINEKDINKTEYQKKNNKSVRHSTIYSTNDT